VIRYTREQLRAAHAAQGATTEQTDALLGGQTVPRAKRTGQTPEGIVLQACKAKLARHPRVLWFARINSGSLGAGPYRANELHANRPGHYTIVDIIGQLVDGRMFAIEVKRDGWRPNAEWLDGPQAAFLRLANSNGGVAQVVTSAEEIAL
jgi:hypothetical protein